MQIIVINIKFEIRTYIFNHMMKTIELRSTESVRNCYISPEVKVIDINAQDMLCQSGSSITGLNLLEDDSDSWN